MGTHYADGRRKSSSPPSKEKGLDPTQVFIVVSYTRKDISERLNNIIECEDLDLQPFAPDDPRLTDAVCEEFVDAEDDALCTHDELVDAVYARHLSCLEDMK